MDDIEKWARLSDLFDPSMVKWKPSATTKDKTRAMAVAYIDARCVMDRLDEVVGPMGWSDSYKLLPNGCVECSLAVMGVSKADVGSESEQPDDGDKTKAAYSDALKRAAVKFGIGRYLYKLPSAWVPYDESKRRLVETPRLPSWAIPSGSRQQESGPRSVLVGDVLRLVTQSGADMDKMLAYHGVDSVDSASESQLRTMKSQLETKIAAQKAAKPQ